MFKLKSQYRCFFENYDGLETNNGIGRNVEDSPTIPYAIPEPVYHGLIVRPGDRVNASLWIDQTPPHGFAGTWPLCPDTNGDGNYFSSSYWAHYYMANSTRNSHATMTQVVCWPPDFTKGTFADFIVENSSGQGVPNFGSINISKCWAGYSSNPYTYDSNSETRNAGRGAIGLSPTDSVKFSMQPLPEIFANNTLNSYLTINPSSIGANGTGPVGFSVSWSSPGSWDPFTTSMSP